MITQRFIEKELKWETIDDSDLKEGDLFRRLDSNEKVIKNKDGNSTFRIKRMWKISKEDIVTFPDNKIDVVYL